MSIHRFYCLDVTPEQKKAMEIAIGNTNFINMEIVKWTLLNEIFGVYPAKQDDKMMWTSKEWFI